jgi:hypothetical protein
MSLIEKQIMLHLDSYERLDPSNSNHQDCYFNITNQLNGHLITEFDRVVCMSFNIAKSYYAIEEGYNTFQIQDTVATGFYTIEITPGTYSSTQFRDYLITEINDKSQLYGASLNYNISFSSITAKYTFTVSGNTEQPIIKTTINVFHNLGFEPNTEYQFVNDALTSINVINLAPENNLMLRTSLCEGGDNNENILQDIHMSNVPPFGYYQFYQHDTEAYSKTLNTDSTYIRVYITNEDAEKTGLQRILNLNGINWTCNILLYKKTTIPKLIKNDLILKQLEKNI